MTGLQSKVTLRPCCEGSQGTSRHKPRWIHVLSEVLFTYVYPLVPLVLATATSGTWICNCLILLVTECHVVNEHFCVNLLI